jgi:hypothetical protein
LVCANQSPLLWSVVFMLFSAAAAAAAERRFVFRDYGLFDAL